MNVAPINGEYFHVSPVSDSTYFSIENIGTVIEVGNKQNPFFSHYEETQEYKVQLPGRTVHVPVLRFLNDVKKGKIKCDDLADRAYNIVNHYHILSRELILEEVRLSVYPTAPSRKTCLWVSDTLELARKWKRKLPQESSIFRLKLEGKFHAGDARLMMNESEPLSQAYEKAKHYWRSETSERPLPEILFAGSATILEEMPSD